MRRWSSWLSLVLALGLVLGFARSAHACEPPVMAPHQVDPTLAAQDRQAPSRPRIAKVDVYRVKDLGTCGSFGVVFVEVANATDDQTTTEELGYEIQIRSGRAPDRIRRIDRQAQFFGSSDLWITLNFDEVQGVDFEFTVTLVDEAGNRGETSDVAKAVFSGCTKQGSGETCAADGGCSLGSRSPHAATLWPLAFVAAVFLRRKWRRGMRGKVCFGSRSPHDDGHHRHHARRPHR